MYQSSTSPQGESPVIGHRCRHCRRVAGVAVRQAPATRSRCIERGDAAMTQATSHWAGGMLAPWCEREASEPVITRLGIRSLDLWREQFPETPFNGSLVVAHPRDRADFERFAKLTSDHDASTPTPCRRARTLARRPISRGAVFSGRRPCRAARRAAGVACANRGGRWRHPFRQRTATRPKPTAS